jgi:hypothetical protein
MADNKNKPQGYTPEDIENSKEFLSNLTKINKELKENKKNNKEILNITKNLESTSSKILLIQKDEIKATDEELQSLSKFLEKKIQELKIEKQILQAKDPKNENEQIQEQLESINTLEGSLVSQQKALQNMMGSSKGFGNALKSAVGESKLLSGLTSKIAPNLIKGLESMNPYVLATTILVELINELIEAFKFLDSSSGVLAKNFGTSYDEAAKLNSELIQTAASSGNIYATTKNLQEAYSDINNAFGTFARLNDKTLLTYTELTKQIGLSKEASLSLFKSSLLTSKPLEKTTKEFMGQAKLMSVQKGLALNQKQLQESISKISSATTLSLKANPKALAEAVVNAKALGVEMDQVEKIANSLLQFESSIENEMAAELLTGKQINLERARLASLNGDIATVAEEIAKQVGTAAQFGKMNVLQQEALAKGVGMEREELAKALTEREALKNIGVKDAAEAKKKFDLLVKEKGYATAVKELGDEQYAKQLQSASLQERFNQLIEKGKELFVQMVEPLMQFVGPYMELLTVYWGELFKQVEAIMEPFKEIGKELGLIKEGSGGFMDIMKKIIPIIIKLNPAIIFLQLTVKEIMFPILQIVKGFNLIKTIIQNIGPALNGNEEAIKKIGESAKSYFIAPFKYLFEIITFFPKKIISAFDPLKGLINSIIDRIENSMLGSVIKKGAGILGSTNIFGSIKSAVGVQDGIAPSSKGPFTITDKYGATAVTAQGDNLAVSPNMSKGNNVSSAGMVEELKAIKQLLSQILNKEGTINIDGNKIGQALSLASYKTQ